MRLTDPLVVRLVNVLVYSWVVFQSVNPVNEEIVEKQVQCDTECHVCPSVIGHIVVKHTLASDFGEEPR